jgi:uncharacterized RmlC-like cupin family protein
VSVNESTGDMIIHGEINHSSLVNSEKSNYWWGGEQNIRRTIFMGDFIYAISGAGITVHNLDSMEQTDVVTFDIEIPDYYVTY